MSEYKRLTGKKWTDDIDLTKEYGYSYIYKRLYELEDKIIDGTLVEFPRIIHPNKLEWFVQFQYETGMIDYNIFYSETEAQAKLKELQEKQK